MMLPEHTQRAGHVNLLALSTPCRLRPDFHHGKLARGFSSVIIDRHLVRQVAMPCLLVSSVLLIIFVAYSLSRFLTQADAGLLNNQEVFYLTLLKALIALEVLLPIGLFFGLLLGLGKLHSDSEIIAMQASGLRETRLIRPVATVAIPLSVIIALMSLFVRPWAYSQTYEMRAIAEASSDINRIKSGQFYLTRTEPAQGVGAEHGGADRERAVFIETIFPDNTLDTVFIRSRTGDEIQIIASQTGVLVEQIHSDHHLLELSDARIFKRVEDGPDLFAKINHFKMRISNKQPEPIPYKVKAVASAALEASSSPKDQAEYQWRLSTPVTTLLLALLTVPLSRSKPRQGRYGKLLLAFVIYAVYYNLIEVSQTWVKQEKASTIWWTPLLLMFLVVAAYRPWAAVRHVFARPVN